MASITDTCSLIMVGIEGVRTFQARMTFSVARLAIIELSRVLRVEEIVGANPRLTSSEFIRMKKAREECGAGMVGPAAEERLVQVRAAQGPFLDGRAVEVTVRL